MRQTSRIQYVRLSRVPNLCAGSTRYTHFDLYTYSTLVAGLTELLGDNFARGHAQASGGSVSTDAFKRLLKAMGFDENGNTLVAVTRNENRLQVQRPVLQRRPRH